MLAIYHYVVSSLLSFDALYIHTYIQWRHHQGPCRNLWPILELSISDTFCLRHQITIVQFGPQHWRWNEKISHAAQIETFRIM